MSDLADISPIELSTIVVGVHGQSEDWVAQVQPCGMVLRGRGGGRSGQVEHSYGLGDGIGVNKEDSVLRLHKRNSNNINNNNDNFNYDKNVIN